MSEITYDDKVDLQVATNIANINKVTASDMNEIKNVVNNNAEEVGDITSLTTTDKTNVVNAVNELNTPKKWVSVGATAPTDGTRVWFAKGKNLYNENAVSLGTISQTDGKTITSNASVRYTPYYIKITPNTSYTLSYSGTTSLTIRAFYYNANYNYLNTSVIGSSTTSQTFTTPQNAYFIRLQFGADYYAKSMQLEEGSTATTYEAYIEQNINVDNSTLIGQDNLVSVGANQPGDGKRVWFAKGKNLFDIDNAYHGTINGSGVVGPNEEFRTTQNIPTQPGKTYYFSTTQKSGTTGNQIYIAYYNSSGTFVSRTSYNLLKSAFTTPANCYYMRAGVRSENQENIMLNEGTIELPYEPYVNPSINIDGEEWYNKLFAIKTKVYPSVTTSDAGYYNLNLLCNEVAIIGMKHDPVESATNIEIYSNQLGQIFIRVSVGSVYSARTITNLKIYYI